jgi:hypothetical protein
MTTTATTTLGAPVWIDLATTDPDAAIAFYKGLFGWEAEAFDKEWGLHNDGTLVAGLSRATKDSDRPPGWLVYLLSADVDSTSLAAHSNGGDVLSRHGEMIVVKDSTGAHVGAWNPGESSAYSFRDEVGAPVWHELHTSDYELAIEFYENVFEWEASAMPAGEGFRMSTLGAGEAGLAGIYDAAADLQGASHWLVYVQVADADEAAAKVEQLGGTVLMPPADSPYGRHATVLDPGGARFAIIQEA